MCTQLLNPKATWMDVEEGKAGTTPILLILALGMMPTDGHRDLLQPTPMQGTGSCMGLGRQVN